MRSRTSLLNESAMVWIVNNRLLCCSANSVGSYEASSEEPEPHTAAAWIWPFSPCRPPWTNVMLCAPTSTRWEKWTAGVRRVESSCRARGFGSAPALCCVSLFSLLWVKIKEENTKKVAAVRIKNDGLSSLWSRFKITQQGLPFSFCRQPWSAGVKLPDLCGYLTLVLFHRSDTVHVEMLFWSFVISCQTLVRDNRDKLDGVGLTGWLVAADRRQHCWTNVAFIPPNIFKMRFGTQKAIYANHPHNHASRISPLPRCINTTSCPRWKEWCFALINPLRLFPRPRLNDTFHSLPAVCLICLQDTVFSVLSQGQKNNTLGGLPIV